ncbi:hypothetical protein N7493_001390 [Penicillium malachiteum]|uniref:Protein PNS1 n=1 Tax=Penicillium malachiteum TaxID=1324776 RepID=A0AAD6HU45_9EURO|nr:hypothetical protein N7493_001390 [Penicillium malachiteum]
MFSESDASRFLAQSQSRVETRPDELQRTGRARPGQRREGNSRNPSTRPFGAGNPYRQTGSQISNFPFASRVSTHAPLLRSTTDEFREEDEETERERDYADFLALQRSRRHFGDSHLRESSELDDESERSASLDGQSPYDDRPGNGKGIKSSWRGETAIPATHQSRIDTVEEGAEYEARSESSPGRTRLVDVGLEDSIRGGLDMEDHSPSSVLGDDAPIQRFRERPTIKRDRFGLNQDDLGESIKPAASDARRPPSSASSFPASMSPLAAEDIMHDPFWAQLFVISLAGLFATAFLVYLHTSTPSGDKSKWGDTVYFTVHRSFFLLGVYTVVSIFVSLIWLALLRSYVRPLVYVSIVAVPVILFSFSLYPFISSFKGSWHGSSVQDKVMRWGSIIPFVMACLWSYNVLRGRRAIGKAISVLEFSCRILAANPELVALGLGVLAGIVGWTWIWMLMFTRVFLGGHFGQRSFIIDVSSWWLGVYFVIIYLWSIGVISGIQRSVTAATVSQWYFHRLANPAPTSRQIIKAAVIHATTTLFGTICLSRFLTLLIRLPLILLPRRVSSILNLFAYSLIPSPIAYLTNSLSLTYAAIHSQPLATSARCLSQMTVLTSSATSSTLHPQSFNRTHGATPSLVSYRLSKLILHAARFMMSLALGFGGWVTTARTLLTAAEETSIRGSLYAYVVGLIAGVIGWSILGATESIIADIVDASVICWASEMGVNGEEARYCREAGWLFGDSNSDYRLDYREV